MAFTAEGARPGASAAQNSAYIVPAGPFFVHAVLASALFSHAAARCMPGKAKLGNSPLDLPGKSVRLSHSSPTGA
jgi:hypothetical protein